MHRRTTRSTLGRLAAVPVLVAILGLAGCDLGSLLEVEDPDTVNPATLEDPALLPIVVAGANGNFASAFNGGDAWVSVTGVMSDEFFSSGTFPTRTATDRRAQMPPDAGNTSDGTYVDLHFARRA
ncbi:MAG: hypothetical protein KY466_13190, partial [Gemmatimonadetes bacterium]|nr:hypothetical protein [Gemmatimonadota bacterium]